ncbi:MAG: flagellar biosynthesis regulatory protein FlaF [Alphaproteobacteria bacterium ADurb.Bin438]|nr:MAG: flagellar biosynthesis regulatory protein FlaF [Alphaproteobacteria bacterium ADurb.Bin438]
MSYGNMGYTNKYKAAEAHGQSQCEIEAGALIRTASRLNEIKLDFENKKHDLDEALTRNRKLWSILISNIGEPDNQMSHELKQNLANLAYFIFKQTIKAMVSHEIKDFEVLIEINMNVARGLTTDRRKNEALQQQESEGVQTQTSDDIPYPPSSSGNTNLGSF